MANLALREFYTKLVQTGKWAAVAVIMGVATAASFGYIPKRYMRVPSFVSPPYRFLIKYNLPVKHIMCEECDIKFAELLELLDLFVTKHAKHEEIHPSTFDDDCTCCGS